MVKRTYPKIAQASEYMQEHGCPAEIEVDGGINYGTARTSIEAGATVLAAGSSLFKSEDMGAEMERWRGIPRP